LTQKISKNFIYDITAALGLSVVPNICSRDQFLNRSTKRNAAITPCKSQNSQDKLDTSFPHQHIRELVAALHRVFHVALIIVHGVSACNEAANVSSVRAENDKIYRPNENDYLGKAKQFTTLDLSKQNGQ